MALFVYTVALANPDEVASEATVATLVAWLHGIGRTEPGPPEWTAEWEADSGAEARRGIEARLTSLPAHLPRLVIVDLHD